MKKNSLTFSDLFCGIGGFRIALDNLGMDCVYACDKDEFVSEIYENNFGYDPFKDIKEEEKSKIPDHNILCGGFPCQPFSIGGKRKGFDEKRGTLFFDILEVLDEKNPEAFLLENVDGLTSHQNGETLEIIKTKLEERGYSVTTKVLNAQHFSLPQTRKRLFIVGFKKELNIQFRENTDEKRLDEFNNDINVFKFPKGSEPAHNLSEFLDSNVEDHGLTETAIKHVKKHVSQYKDKDKYDPEYPMIISEIRPSRCTIRNDGTVPTLTARMGTGGNNVPALYSELRKLTVREVIRLQGFPEWFNIRENYYKSYKAVGNSVPVPMVQAIAKNMKECLIKAGV